MARVMTIDEVRNGKPDMVEFYINGHVETLVCDEFFKGKQVFQYFPKGGDTFPIITLTARPYNREWKAWRAWEGIPTLEEMLETPWGDGKVSFLKDREPYA